MTYIGECRAPELSSIGTPVGSKYMLNCVFCGAGTADRTAASYVIIYILAVDKAVREYTSERELLVQYAASENRTMLLLVGLGHFETCINSVKRALRCVDRLARYPLGPDVDREIRRVLASYTQSVTPLRDAIEHMDAFVVCGELQDGEPHVLAVSRDCESLEIAGHRLQLHSLAQLLRRLHELASDLAAFKESVWERPGAEPTHQSEAQ